MPSRYFVKPGSLSILIIEDNAQLAANLYDFLEARGHRLDAAPDGPSGLHLASTQAYDAVVLDWNLPRMDGLTVLRRLRQAGRTRVPVVMLTARDNLDDKIDGFESGVDDYLVKPVALPELEVRLRALVARLKDVVSEGSTLVVADLRFDPGTLECWRGERPVALTPILRRLLEVLMRDSPNVVTRQQLTRAAWQEAPEADILRSHMYLLRRALDQGTEPKLLHTVSGSGYRLCVRN